LGALKARQPIDFERIDPASVSERLWVHPDATRGDAAGRAASGARTKYLASSSLRA